MATQSEVKTAWTKEWASWLRALAFTIEHGTVTQETFGPDAPKHLRLIAEALEAAPESDAPRTSPSVTKEMKR